MKTLLHSLICLLLATEFIFLSESFTPYYPPRIHQSALEEERKRSPKQLQEQQQRQNLPNYELHCELKEKEEINNHVVSRRRIILNNLASLLLTTLPVVASNPLSAIAEMPSSTNAPSAMIKATNPVITHKVYLNVRISRADGSFYVRDDPPGTIPSPDNQVYTGTLTLGLYGDLTPNHVKQFLKYADVLYNPTDDVPLPSYSRSLFTSFDQSNGLLSAGNIPSLHLTNFNGASAIEYKGRIYPSALWIDNEQERKISHSKSGLLTHRNLEALPNFGITTRSANELNASHTVFGEVIPTESSKLFFDRVVDLPTYSNNRPMGGTTTTSVAVAENEVASSVYSFQKDFFRSAAKTFGDTRLDNVYEGKLLRRLEVTSVNVEKL